MLSDKDRRAVAAAAVREAEIKDLLANRVWRVSYVPQKEGAEKIVFRTPDEEKPVDRLIAELIVDAAEWKRRALKHGCQPDGDPDCG